MFKYHDGDYTPYGFKKHYRNSECWLDWMNNEFLDDRNIVVYMPRSNVYTSYKPLTCIETTPTTLPIPAEDFCVQRSCAIHNYPIMYDDMLGYSEFYKKPNVSPLFVSKVQNAKALQFVSVSNREKDIVNLFFHSYNESKINSFIGGFHFKNCDNLNLYGSYEGRFDTDAKNVNFSVDTVLNGIFDNAFSYSTCRNYHLATTDIYSCASMFEHASIYVGTSPVSIEGNIVSASNMYARSSFLSSSSMTIYPSFNVNAHVWNADYLLNTTPYNNISLNLTTYSARNFLANTSLQGTQPTSYRWNINVCNGAFLFSNTLNVNSAIFSRTPMNINVYYDAYRMFFQANSATIQHILPRMHCYADNMWGFLDSRNQTGSFPLTLNNSYMHSIRHNWADEELSYAEHNYSFAFTNCNGPIRIENLNYVNAHMTNFVGVASKTVLQPVTISNLYLENCDMSNFFASKNLNVLAESGFFDIVDCSNVGYMFNVSSEAHSIKNAVRIVNADLSEVQAWPEDFFFTACRCFGLEGNTNTGDPYWEQCFGVNCQFQDYTLDKTDYTMHYREVLNVSV